MKLLNEPDEEYKKKSPVIISEFYYILRKYAEQGLIDQDDAIFLTIDFLHSQIKVYTQNKLLTKEYYYKVVYNTLRAFDDKEKSYKESPAPDKWNSKYYNDMIKEYLKHNRYEDEEYK